VLNENLRRILQREVDYKAFPRPARPSAPWNDQIEEASFWFCALACLLLIGFQAFISFNFNAKHNLTDYGSLYASASLANVHVDPYRDHPLVFHLREIYRHGPDTPLQGNRVDAINLNPPVLLYPFRPLSRLYPDTSFFTWTCISVGLFVASVLLVLNMYPAERLRIRVLWILTLGGVWYTFRLGQIYMILLFLTSLAWWALRKQKWLAAGISIGLICAIKPNFLVWPGLLIVGKSKKIGFAAMATTAVISAIPLVLQGPVVYRQWIAACRRFNGYELPGNSSLLAIFSRAGVPNLGLAITVLMLAAVTIWVFLTKPEPLYASEIGILASLFAGPISWLGYTILLIPVLYGKSMDTLTRIGCVLLCIPVWVTLPSADTSRITYILFWAPNLYPLALIAFSAVYSSGYIEET
jgi:Glycosyltransferase family 87